MSLSEFIQGNLEPILSEWQRFARTLFPPEHRGSAERLRDHAGEILISIAQDMLTAQSATQQQRKSEGRRHAPLGQDSAAETHAASRVEEGFSLNDLFAEYRALRATVIRLWTAETQYADRSTLEEMTRFNEAIDEALSEAVARYTARVGRARDLMLGALGHDLRNPLGAVLQSAQYLLRDHKRLRGRVLCTGRRAQPGHPNSRGPTS